LQAVKDKGYSLFSFDELKKLGAAKPVEPVPPSPEDLCTIMFTSGTTGGNKEGEAVWKCCNLFNAAFVVLGEHKHAVVYITHVIQRIIKRVYIGIVTSVLHTYRDMVAPHPLNITHYDRPLF
jgi:acyl-coenzyme A synthetase/AMP-(fatty) acid ligase